MYTDPKTAYRSTKATTSIHEASPHKLITLLLEACQENLAVVKGAMSRGDRKQKGEVLKKCLDIIANLQASLDFERGGEIAIRLDALYSFCVNHLALANITNDTEKVDEVHKVISEIKRGWLELEGVAR